MRLGKQPPRTAGPILRTHARPRVAHARRADPQRVDGPPPPRDTPRRAEAFRLARSSRRREATMMMAERAARERDQRDEQHPPRPEVAVRAAEEPDQDRDHVD